LLRQYAVAASSDALVELLLKRGANPNARRQPIFQAIGSRKEIELFIKYGANVNIRNKLGETPLFYAVKLHTVQASKLAVAELLLSNGAEVNIRDVDGKTPLQLAIEGKYTDMETLLCKYGAKE